MPASVGCPAAFTICSRKPEMSLFGIVNNIIKMRIGMHECKAAAHALTLIFNSIASNLDKHTINGEP